LEKCGAQSFFEMSNALCSEVRQSVLLLVRNGFVNEQQVDRAITAFVRRLGPEVVRVRYNISEDWTGDPAIFFRVVLTDQAGTEEDRRWKVTTRIRTALQDKLKPYERWGLIPFIHFRSKSEQDSLKEESWS
jgi:hypothetical protein